MKKALQIWWIGWLNRRGWGDVAHATLIDALTRALAQQGFTWDGTLPLPVPPPWEWDAVSGRFICNGVRVMENRPRIDIRSTPTLFNMWWRIARARNLGSVLAYRETFRQLCDENETS